MANTLMFEIGVQEAKGQLTALENRLKEIVDKYGSMQIKVDVQNLQKFITALESIGNGKQLEPLLERIDLMQRRLAAMGNSGSFLNFLKSEAEQAARVMEGYEKKFAEIRNAFSIYPEKDAPKREAQINRIKESEEYQRALERHTNASRELAQEQERLANAQKNEGNAASELNSKIQQLSQSIESLSGKTFSVNMGNEFKTWAQEVQNLTTQVKELVAQFEKLNQTGKVNAQSNLFDTQKFMTLQEAIDKIIGEVNRLAEVFNTVGKSVKLTTSTEEVTAMEKKVAELRAQYEQLQQAVQQTTTAITQQTTAQKSATSADQKKTIEMLKQQKMLIDVQELYKKISSLGGVGMNNNRINSLSGSLQQLIADLTTIPPAKSLQILSSEFAVLKAQARSLFNELKQGAQATTAAASATSHLVAEEQKLAQAISHSTNEMRQQSQVLSDLKMMAMQYISIWGAQSFINNIIETGGLLEQQRLSIGAILQNAGEATELFGQIKQLALKSPFGVVELDKMSKQLTAYGFEYKELYDWTKRLADISAATGTSVDRLALALGHVRAEGALSGYTLRQFAMGNVPLLRMLAENLDITTKQVREKVRKKDISYDDVMEVLKQLTDEGGMFYNAQEVMSQALNAKFKNLRDAFDIMYNEIAEGGVGDALKELAAVLTTGAKHWRELGTIILWTGSAFGIAKLATLAYNQAVGAGTVATLKSAAADKRKEVEMLQLARNYRTLTVAEQQLINTHGLGVIASGKLTAAQLTLLLDEKKLGREELLRSVALGKINKELALKAILEMKAGTAEERHLKAELLWGLRSTQVLSKSKRAWLVLGEAIGSASKALWSFTKMALPMAAFSALVEMFARVKQMNEEASQGAADLAEKATSDMKVIDETFKELQNDKLLNLTEKSGSYVNGRRVVQMSIGFNDEELSKKDLTEDIENLKGKLQELSPMYDGDLLDIEKMDNQVEQFKLIVKKLESIRHANDVTEATSDAVTGANTDVAGGNWFTKAFGDTYTQDLKDYEDELKETAKVVNKLNEETIDEIDKELNGLLTAFKQKYNLDSKNSALGLVFSNWSKAGQIPSYLQSNSKVVKLFLDEMTGGAFDKPLSEQYRQFESDTKKMAETLASIVVNQFKDDPEGAMYAIRTYMQKLFSMAGITDPRVMDEATRMMLDEMRHHLNYKQNMSVIDEMERRILREKFSELLGNTITESTTPEEAEKALKKYSEMTIMWGKTMNYDLKRIGMDNAEAYRSGLQAKLNSFKPKTDWQKRASAIFVQNVSIKSNFDKSLDEFAQAVQKDLKEKQDYLTRNKAHLKMKLNINTDILMNVDKLKALIETLKQLGIDKMKKGDYGGAKEIFSRVNDEIMPFYNALVAVNEDKKWLKSEGYPEKDPTKGRKSGNRASKEDKNAKAVRERVRIIKEAADAFQYWREKVGDRGAWQHVLDEFGEVLEKIGITAENVKDVRGNLDRIKNSAEFKAIKDPKVKLEVEKEMAKEKSQLNRKDFEETSKDFASQVKLEIDSLTRSWEIFNKVREATGDIDLASALGGGTYDYVGDLIEMLGEYSRSGDGIRNLADAIKEKLKREFEDIGESIVFDMNLSDEQIGDRIKAAMPKESEKKIQGFIDLYKQWRDLQRDVFKNDIDVFAKLVGSAKDYASQLRVINTQEDLQIEALDAIVKDNPELQGDVDRAKAMVNADAEEKRWKLTSVYTQLMNNSLALTREEIEYGINKQVDILNQKMQAGLITAQEYADEMAKVDNIRSEWNKNSFFGKSSAFAAGLFGGVSGRANYYRGQINKAREGGETDKEGKYIKKLGRLESFDNLMNQFKALANALDPVINLFDQLGMKDVGQAIGIGQNALNNAASMGANAAALFGESAGPYGAAIGAGLSIVSGIFAMHDAALQEEIDALKANNAALDANTEVIKAIRERTLGYDTGDIRRRLASDYILPDPSKDFSAWWKTVTNASYMAMREFYGYNSEGSGYSQELENLRKERENYMNMYRAEKGKKDSSEEDLEEYKKKIAELDEQILYFTQDLYKELWSIDIKGWSDQIGDALWAAFENGEDAVKAFGDTAKEIVSGVAKDMWELSILQPMFEDLQKALFGTYENGRFTGGTIRYDSNGNIDMQASEQPTLEVLGKFFGENGFYQNAIDSGEQFFDWVQSVTGMDLTSKDSSSSKIIQGGFDENETGLLLSYVNACRADLSVVRQLHEKASQEYWPSQIGLMTSANNALVDIRSHAAAIENSNESIRESVDDIYSLFRGLRTETWRIPVH